MKPARVMVWAEVASDGSKMDGWMDTPSFTEEGAKVNIQVYIKILTEKCYPGSPNVVETVTSSLKTVLGPTHRI